MKILNIKSSSYYYSKKEKRNQRAIENEILLSYIRLIWQDSKKRYGAKKVNVKLRKMGLEVNLKRVKRIMKENRIFSIITKKYKYYKKGNESVSLVRNVLNRDFSTETINEKWVSDITYIWSRKEGWCYLSSIMDLCSNRIISHKVGKFMDIKLVMETLKEAYYVRGRKSNIIIHTDRGSQYMSKEYRDYCKSSKMIVSYSRKGNPYDNACIESFHATLKKEYIHHKKFDTIEEIKVGVFEYIEKWYNRERIQEKIGYLTPVEFEEMSKKLYKKCTKHLVPNQQLKIKEDLWIKTKLKIYFYIIMVAVFIC